MSASTSLDRAYPKCLISTGNGLTVSNCAIFWTSYDHTFNVLEPNIQCQNIPELCSVQRNFLETYFVGVQINQFSPKELMELLVKSDELANIGFKTMWIDDDGSQFEIHTKNVNFLEHIGRYCILCGLRSFEILWFCLFMYQFIQKGASLLKMIFRLN